MKASPSAISVTSAVFSVSSTGGIRDNASAFPCKRPGQCSMVKLNSAIQCATCPLVAQSYATISTHYGRSVLERSSPQDMARNA